MRVNDGDSSLLVFTTVRALSSEMDQFEEAFIDYAFRCVEG
jgi:hypothetical protein